MAFENWFLPRFGQQRRIELSVDSFGMAPLKVVGTERIVAMHRRQAEHFARQLPVRLVETPFEMPPLVESMAWPPHLERDPAHLWLRQTIEECALELPAAGPGQDGADLPVDAGTRRRSRSQK